MIRVSCGLGNGIGAFFWDFVLLSFDLGRWNHDLDLTMAFEGWCSVNVADALTYAIDNERTQAWVAAHACG